MIFSSQTTEDRFVGCLLGLTIGDALGAHFEGMPQDDIVRQYRSVSELFNHPPEGVLWYTDDTQMTIGVAETLRRYRRIDERDLCRRFAANYDPNRGYGGGARAVISAIRRGHDYRSVANDYFPGGSFGNGAAMRVAPVGLLFRDDHDTLWEEARLSALPTHVHPLGIEGAQIIAFAVAMASSVDELNRESFFENIAARCSSLEYSGPLRRAATLNDVRDLGLYGNGIEATSSVVTAVASFGLTPDSFNETIGNAILLGGDTDTIAAMAGAISGAYLGREALPGHLLERLEDGRQGRSYIERLAKDLHHMYLKSSEEK
jgi:poly(ADP-ribose) glycohydrolase ARH3